MTNTTAAAKTAAAAILNPCTCSQFAAIVREFTLGNGQPDTDEQTTGCTATTAREFAPGHDAKLKALLIEAGTNGWEVRQGNITSDAMKAASQFAFAYMVEAGIKRGKEKAAAKADRNSARVARADRPKGRVTRKVTTAPAASTTDHVVATVAPAAAPVAPAAPATVKIKVGRWEYAATIVDGDAHYTSGKGAAAVAVKGTYKLV